MDVLMVCTGNICRSPMAEGLLRAGLERRGIRDVTVSSAGTWAGYGNAATPAAIEAAAALNVDISGHRSRPLTATLLREADLVIAMTSVHRREIEQLLGEAARKTFLLKELAELDLDGAGSRLEALLGAPRPEYRRALDLDDPMGLPFATYERCAGYILSGVEALADHLWPPERENAG